MNTISDLNVETQLIEPDTKNQTPVSENTLSPAAHTDDHNYVYIYSKTISFDEPSLWHTMSMPAP